MSEPAEDNDTQAAGGDEPQFKSVADWVENWLVVNYSRPLNDAAKYRWDPQWWRYSEVVIRLEAVWGSYESMRLEGGPGMVAWFRDYLDPMMAVILSPDGPFHAYKPHENDADGPREMPSPLPSTPLPLADWFSTDFDDEQDR